jgi:myosin protein heavy chain
MRARNNLFLLTQPISIFNPYSDKYSKILTELEAMATALNEAENKANQASKASDSLESNLGEATALLEEETRQKLALNSKLRAMEQEKEVMSEQLEEEEETKRALEKQLFDSRSQLSELKKKADEESELVTRLEEIRKKNMKDIEELTHKLDEVIIIITHYALRFHKKIHKKHFQKKIQKKFQKSF